MACQGSTDSLYGRRDGRFRILQITDLHTDKDGGAATWQAIGALVETERPNLLAVTGDIWCSDGEPLEAPARMAADLERLGALGVPWGFCWGNHDWGLDMPAAWAEIADAPNSVTSLDAENGNYGLTVLEPETEEPAWDVFFLNAHEESLGAADLQWLDRTVRGLRDIRMHHVPAVAFFHIPLMHFEQARREANYTGLAGERVLYWGDDGRCAPAIAAVDCVRACFVGHSHKNDYWFEDQGVVWAYGRAGGLGGYGGEIIEKGCKVIDLAPGRISFETVAYGGRRWGRMTAVLDPHGRIAETGTG